MSNFVADASAAAAWCFEDEATPASEALLDRVGRDGVIVPSLWYIELSNVLCLADRKGRITSQQLAGAVSLLNSLRISVDDQTSRRAFADTLHLARTHRLTAYDAAYLELALRLGLPLASKDQDLRRAAQQVGVELLEV